MLILGIYIVLDVHVYVLVAAFYVVTRKCNKNKSFGFFFLSFLFTFLYVSLFYDVMDGA